jgi:hypothetical protein
MYMLRIFFNVFIVLPLIALSSCSVGGYMGGGLRSFSWLFAIPASIIACFAYLVWDTRRVYFRFRNHGIAEGLNPEYVACYEDNGIIIDNTKKKAFVGEIKGGKVLEFAKISSIEREDRLLGDRMKYILHVKTMDFDSPSILVGFSGNRGPRDEAFEKLRAALAIA